MAALTDDEGDLNLELDAISPDKVGTNEFDPALNSVLQVIAENKEVYGKIFLKYEMEKRIFALKLYQNGKPQVVIIDEYLVTDEEDLPVSDERSDFSVFLI